MNIFSDVLKRLPPAPDDTGKRPREPKFTAAFLLPGQSLRQLRDPSRELTNISGPPRPSRNFNEKVQVIPDIRITVDGHTMFLGNLADGTVHFSNGVWKA